MQIVTSEGNHLNTKAGCQMFHGCPFCKCGWD